MSHLSPYPIQGGEKIRASRWEDFSSAKNLPNVRFHPFDFLSQMKPMLRYYLKSRVLVKHTQGILEKYPIDRAVIDYQFYGKYIECFHLAKKIM